VLDAIKATYAVVDAEDQAILTAALFSKIGIVATLDAQLVSLRSRGFPYPIGTRFNPMITTYTRGESSQIVEYNF